MVASMSNELFPRPVRVYIAGPMRGVLEFNFPAFHEAAARLRAMGHTVFNPAERDIEQIGRDVSKEFPTGDAEALEKKYGVSIRNCLGADLAWICEHAEAIALLPGWERSYGATAEWATAIALGLYIREL
jgi:hypothetical protein